MDLISVDLGKEWLTVADICEYMDVTPFVTTKMIRAGELPAVKFGREWRISSKDFEDFLNAQRMASQHGKSSSAKRKGANT